MLKTKDKKFYPYPYSQEADLEAAITEVEGDLFGEQRIYLDVKKKIGAKGKTNNIPDGYLIDLTSAREPLLYVVENELASHDPLKHVAVQILEFSLSFESAPHKVKAIVKDALADHPDKWKLCEKYAADNGFENVDYLLESMIFSSEAFRALVIIDELVEELETLLISRFKFPVEVLTLERYKAGKEVAYRFEPFLYDVANDATANGKLMDPSEIDTIVVPAREDGFKSAFLGEQKWWAIRIHASMIPKIKYIAAYQVAPISAITHIAPVADIEPWKDTGKYRVDLAAKPSKIKPIPLVPKGKVKAPQAPRYASRKKLLAAKSLDQVF
jgi:hypothetical protein